MYHIFRRLSILQTVVDPRWPFSTQPGRFKLTNLKTNKSLLRAIYQPASQRPTEDDVRKQRISFVMGSLKSSNTATPRRGPGNISSA